MTSHFSASAQKLARNPLGIIALFLVLVYGIAGLVFSTAAKSLATSERQPLVWFLVLFPVLVLAMFGWLVARHHTKLYAPSDYRDSEGFFRALTVGEQRARLDAEVESLQGDIPDTEPIRVAAEARDEAHRRPSEMPPNESGATTGSTTATQAKDPRDSTVQLVERRRSELRAAVVLAEELACRKLEADFRLPVLRSVSLTNGAQIDGLIRTPIRPTAVEIKYTRSSKNVERIASEMIARLVSIENGSTIGPLQILLVIVVDAPRPEERPLIERVLERLLSHMGQVSYRVYDFKALQEEFGVVPPSCS